MLVRVGDLRVLLTEGSSLSSREVVSCLGPAGYHLEVLDPDAICLARFSRWVRKAHRCPHAGADPLGYLEALNAVVAERRIDVVLPTHEQAWLLANARPMLAAGVRVAVAEPAAFERVQSKVAFARLLDELGLAAAGLAGRRRGRRGGGPAVSLLAEGRVQHRRPGGSGGRRCPFARCRRCGR